MVFYHHGSLVSKRIAPVHGNLLVVVDTLRPADTLTCFVAETKQEFRVPLHSVGAVPDAVYPVAEKLVAISDIEGNFKGLQQLLRGAGVVNERLAWQFGRGHLVLVGDFFDRGLNVTECLWLLYKLEQEAERAGGRVHFIMGNHERMNLTGHLRYLRRKYRVSADTLKVPYQNWYDRNALLGQWLRTKNVVERIGPTLFVHGGISPGLAARALPLERLNELARKSLDTPLSQLTPLEKQVTQHPESPDWYRGLVLEEPTEAQVATVLTAYAATAMVVGHTPVERPRMLYHGKIVAIDSPHQQRTDAGEPLEALGMENGSMHLIDSKGRKSAL
ncbi:metallophosphoesterase [Hymenobacter ruricola]|uniref:Metallophosphoesterase n=1 Tax=Hymenobacter ruricola TaxID=2791023 RepID=A0ABS0I6C6_9BACT|nr:metallophosphoesterase [Hymenobacter ruricola]MBF9222238.1 metallophosphoesterase [Hymenobacter ruricola]